MAILNFYTKIDASRTISEIQKTLAGAGAKAVLIEFDDDGIETAVSFRMLYKEAMISFRLPSNLDSIYVLLQRDDSRHSRPAFRTREHAARVAWRIIKDWVEAQCAIVEAEQAEMVQVFLPYAQVPETGQTLFQHLEQKQFKLLGGPHESHNL